MGLTGLALLACLLNACAFTPPSGPLTTAPHLVALDPAECRSALRDDAPLQSLREVAARNTVYLDAVPAERTLMALDRQVTVAELRELFSALSAADSEAAWIEEVCDRARLYRAVVPGGVLVTGYYEPELAASRTRTERFRYPLYRTPNDLVDIHLGDFCDACAGRVTQGRVHDGRLVPYYSRAEIDMGALAGRDYEIAWLDDPVEAFFLHVQGSARLRFDDGVAMQVSYNSSNGRPYTSIGRVLVEQGRMARETVSLKTLKDYLRAHPEEQAALMAANERYIFFRTVPTGAVGSLGVPLTAGRSIAADARVYPPGGLGFLRIEATSWPATNPDAPAYQRFVVIQDAGAAITGPGRLDVFWGSGSTAEDIAGDLRNPGELYLVLPR